MFFYENKINEMKNENENIYIVYIIYQSSTLFTIQYERNIYIYVCVCVCVCHKIQQNTKRQHWEKLTFVDC